MTPSYIPAWDIKRLKSRFAISIMKNAAILAVIGSYVVVSIWLLVISKERAPTELAQTISTVSVIAFAFGGLSFIADIVAHRRVLRGQKNGEPQLVAELLLNSVESLGWARGQSTETCYSETEIKSRRSKMLNAIYLYEAVCKKKSEDISGHTVTELAATLWNLGFYGPSGVTLKAAA